jgi:hypothetical protein
MSSRRCNCPNNVWLALVTFVLLVAIAVNAALESDWTRLAFLQTALGVLLITAFAYRHGSGPKILSRCPGSRYEYIPTVMVIWCIVLRRSPRWQAAKFCLLLLIALASASHFRFWALKDYQWSTACEIVVQNRAGRMAGSLSIRPGEMAWKVEATAPALVFLSANPSLVIAFRWYANCPMLKR